MRRARVHLIVAARPNFMKIAPLHAVLAAGDWCTPVLVHTGQHYDPLLSDVFLRELGLPPPSASLETGSGTHAEQTGAVMVAYERYCRTDRPDWTIVPGDVNSTLACTIAAKKLGIPVAHLEAGLRSGDRTMPEELNRIMTDSVADLLWTPSADADANLLREGVAPDRVEAIGNVMIDSLERLRPRIDAAQAWRTHGLTQSEYAVVTLHRPVNVDTAPALETLLVRIAEMAARLPVVFPVHPRTAARIAEFGLGERLARAGIVTTPPLGYIEFMSLVANARLVATDSGGVQEETTYLGIPCVTLRDTTERPITVTLGTNVLAALDALPGLVERALAGGWKRASVPPLWDGSAALRAAASLRRRIAPA